MSHKNRTWFVSIDNESTNQLVEDIAGFDINTDFERDLIIHEEVDGVEKKVKKNLARLPSFEGVQLLQAHRSSKGLKFRIYMKESSGAKIVRWVGDKPTSKTAIKKKMVPASDIV